MIYFYEHRHSTMHESNALAVPANAEPQKDCFRQISSQCIVLSIYLGLLILLRTDGRRWLGVVSGISVFEEGVIALQLSRLSVTSILNQGVIRLGFRLILATNAIRVCLYSSCHVQSCLDKKLPHTTTGKPHQETQHTGSCTTLSVTKHSTSSLPLLYILML